MRANNGTPVSGPHLTLAGTSVELADIIDYFDVRASSWDHSLVRNEAVLASILDFAAIGKGVSVLDVACGTGVLFGDYLSRDVASLTAIDVSAKMAKIARAKHRDPRLCVLCGDVLTAGFDRLFDRIVVYNAFPHFPEPARLVERLSSLLTPGGRLTIAHGMSRERINAHHGGSAKPVSIGLMSETDLASLASRWLDVDIAVSDDCKYAVSGVKR
ncbi:MAG TPA: class I SAM-dependent methyltransferase [Treponemataceae bacterium]|nr:class I SAM-dependent methyltransferase [Treponemataceae bacterium]HQL34011.1 class I SAM-dependent methyltransferase [Treponemataceae bacterium]